MSFLPLYYPKKSIFELQNWKKDLEKKFENLGALPRISSLKAMAVAGLKIEFWKFWFSQKLGLDEDSHVSKNLSKIPTIRGPNCTFFYGGDSRESAQIFELFFKVFFSILKLKNRLFGVT